LLGDGGRARFLLSPGRGQWWPAGLRLSGAYRLLRPSDQLAAFRLAWLSNSRPDQREQNCYE